MKIEANGNKLFNTLCAIFAKYDPVGLNQMVDDVAQEYSIEVECLINTHKEDQLDTLDDVQDCLEFIIEEYFSMDVEIDIEFAKEVAVALAII